MLERCFAKFTGIAGWATTDVCLKHSLSNEETNPLSFNKKLGILGFENQPLIWNASSLLSGPCALARLRKHMICDPTSREEAHGTYPVFHVLYNACM